MKTIPSKYKKSGWFGDSYRHFLAAKGVKTAHDFKVDFFSRRNKAGTQPESDKQFRLPTGDTEELIELFKISDLSAEEKESVKDITLTLETNTSQLEDINTQLQSKHLGDVISEEKRLLDDRKQLNTRLKQLKANFNDSDVDSEQRELFSGQIEQIQEALSINASILDPLQEQLAPIRSAKSEIREENINLRNDLDALTGKARTAAPDVRTLTTDQLIQRLPKEGVASLLPAEMQVDMQGASKADIVQEVRNQLSDFEIRQGFIGLMNEGLVKTGKGRRNTIVNTPREQLLERAENAIEMAEEAQQKAQVGGNMRSENIQKEVMLPAGDIKRFSTGINEDDRASEADVKRQKNEEKAQKQEVRDLKEEGALPEDFNADKFYSKKQLKKASESLGPIERIVAAPYLRSVKSIEQVQRSKYGGFRSKDE